MPERQLGFSVIELMIVMMIISVIVSIAYPNYMDYMDRTKRGDAMAELQQMNTRIESEKLIHKKYANVPLENIAPPGASISGGKFNMPANGTALYTVTVLDISTAGAETAVTGSTLSTRRWKIQAEPIADIGPEGNLTIDSKGEKCWKTSCGMNDEWQKE